MRGLHTHAYGEHEHGDHRHGPAAHEHHEYETTSEPTEPHASSCDPGRHLVPYMLVCHPPAQAHAVDADCILPLMPARDHTSPDIVRIGEIRVHGPPALASSSPRAPPLVLSV